MSTVEFVTSENLNEDGRFVSLPGTYHLFITDAHEQPQKSDGTLLLDSKTSQPLNGRQINTIVLAGTEPSQIDKNFDAIFFNAGPDDEKWKQESARKQMTGLIVAAGIVSPAQLGQKVAFDWKDLINKHLIVTLEIGKNGRLQITRGAVYHVDDPRAATFPKYMDLINTPSTIRRKPEDFAGIIASETPAARATAATAKKPEGAAIPF